MAGAYTRGQKRKRECAARLPALALLKVAERVDEYDRFAFSLTCKAFRDAIREVLNPKKKAGETGATSDEGKEKKALVSNLQTERLEEKTTSYSLDWFKWAYGLPERRDGLAPWNRYRNAMPDVYDSELLLLAAFQGSLEALKWLMSKGAPLLVRNWASGKRAAWGGNIEVLEFLRSEGYEFNQWTCYYAARGGQIETLAWLRSQDPPCPWDENVCLAAADKGKTATLHWLRSQDPPCPWSPWSCVSAIQGGHLETLKWLRSQDPPCDWDSDSCNMAAAKGNLQILQWLRSQNPPCLWNKSRCRSMAELRGHDHVVRWIDEKDVARNNNVEIDVTASFRSESVRILELFQLNFAAVQ